MFAAVPLPSEGEPLQLKLMCDCDKPLVLAPPFRKPSIHT